MKFRKFHLILYGFALLSLVCFGVLTLVSGSLGDIGDPAARWQGESDQSYAQISLFMGQEAALTESDVRMIAESVDAALLSASFQADSPEKRLWFNAYSTQLGNFTMSGTKTYSASAAATAIGGDFFLMHPMTLLSGNYITEKDLMKDRVVLDETIAWQLFGSSDVSGMEVIVNDRRCIVAGVVRPESDYATEAAYGESPRFYMPYALAREWEEDSIVLNCYEAVLPEPVRGFAETTLTNAAGTRDSMRIVQNTGRYSLKNRWNNLRHIHEMLLNPDSAAFPYWENAARIVDYDRAVLLAFQIAFLVAPVLCMLWLLWLGYRWVRAFTDKIIKRFK